MHRPSGPCLLASGNEVQGAQHASHCLLPVTFCTPPAPCPSFPFSIVHCLPRAAVCCTLCTAGCMPLAVLPRAAIVDDMLHAAPCFLLPASRMYAACCMLFAVSCVLLAACCLPLAACRLPLAACRLPLAACAKSSPVQVRSPDQWSSRLRRARA